jgi:hypothetical protein
LAEGLVKSLIFIAEKEFEGFFCSYFKNWKKDKKFFGLLEKNTITSSGILDLSIDESVHNLRKKSNSERLLNSSQLLSTIEY